MSDSAHLRQLLEDQNARLYSAARDRDAALRELSTLRRGLEAGEGETAEQIVQRITALRRRDGDLLREAEREIQRLRGEA